MSDAATGGAPASNGGDTGTAPALPQGMLSVPQTVDKRGGNKKTWIDLENEAFENDEPIEKKPEYKDEDEKKPAKKAEPEKKAKPPVVKEPRDEPVEEDVDEDAEEDEDEDEKPTKPRKKRALELTNDDEDEDGEAVEASNDEDDTAEQTAEDSSKIDPKELDKKYKIAVKDGDKSVEKDYSLKQLIAMAQKNETGDRKLYEAAEAYKKVENIIERLKSEPFEVLKYIASQTNQDYYQMIEGAYAEQFKLNMMEPEARQAYLQEQQDKRDLQNFRAEQQAVKERMAKEALTKQQQEITSKFIDKTGEAIQSNPYLKQVYDNLEEGDDKNYIIKKFGHLVQQALLMKQKPKGDPHYLDPNFDLSPTNPVLVDLVVKEIQAEAQNQIKQAQKAAKYAPGADLTQAVVNSAGTKVREKIPGVKSSSGITKKANSQQKKAKKQSTHEFLRELLY